MKKVEILFKLVINCISSFTEIKVWVNFAILFYDLSIFILFLVVDASKIA